MNQTCAARPNPGGSEQQVVQRGCCSHHQGVCGCNGGRVVCCDSTYSRSCTCNKEDPIGVVN
jgi:hypothetical protein